MQLRDQLQFMLQQPTDLFRHAARIAPPCAGPGKLGQILVGRQARRGQLLGILVTQLVERKRAAVGNLHRATHGSGASAKRAAMSAGDFKCRSALANRCGTASATVHVVTHGRQHVVQRRTLGHVIMHVAGGDQRDARLPRKFLQPGQFPPVVRPTVQFGQQIAAIAK